MQYYKLLSMATALCCDLYTCVDGCDHCQILHTKNNNIYIYILRCVKKQRNHKTSTYFVHTIHLHLLCMCILYTICIVLLILLIYERPSLFSYKWHQPEPNSVDVVLYRYTIYAVFFPVQVLFYTIYLILLVNVWNTFITKLV